MSLVTPLRSRRQSRRKLAFALAVVLPIVGTVVTRHMGVLHGIPASTNLLSVVVVGLLGGLAPSMLATLVATITRCCVLLVAPGHALSIYYESTHAAILVVAALLVWWMIRQRRRSEEKLEDALTALQERTDDLVASLQNSKCACWTLDLDSGRSARWYSGSYQLFGRPYSEVEEMSSQFPLGHAEDKERMSDMVQSMKISSEPVVFEYRTVWPSGEVHVLEMRGNRASGSRCVWRGVALDITERKLTEAALVRAEKLAAMGRLASTVAHEINNPLESVTNLLYLARSGTSMDETTHQYLEVAEQELTRLSNITRLTLGFVRTSASAAETRIQTVVDEVLSIFRHRFEMKNIRIECHCEPDVCIIIAPHELRQIATNLIANATDAVPVSKGRIVIDISREENMAVLQVEDNGDGIDQANLARIFEAFFSTKEDVGTGIGLWVTKELVEKNGGQIFLQSSRTAKLPSGASTQFRVEFPLVR